MSVQLIAETPVARHAWERIDAAAALNFWERSPHATAFTHPRVLCALAGQVDWWLCRKGDAPMCLWPVAADWVRQRLPPPWAMYVGPMWSAAAWDMPAHRWLAESTRVYAGFLSRLLTVYGSIHAHLVPGLSDVRGFQWWADANPGRASLRVRPQYSAVLTGLQRGDSEIVANWRSLRRRELKRANALRPRLRPGLDLDELQRLYLGIFGRQGGCTPPGQLESLSVLLELTRTGLGTTLAVDVRGELAFAGLLLFDRTHAHLVVNVLADEFRGSGLSAWSILELIRSARDRGCQVFDFDGANSPRRGDDKHSYGATPVLYFELVAEAGAG